MAAMTAAITTRRPWTWPLTFLAVMTLLLTLILRGDGYEYYWDEGPGSSNPEDAALEHDCALNASTAEMLALRGPVYYGRLAIDVLPSGAGKGKWYQYHRAGPAAAAGNNSAAKKNLDVPLPIQRHLGILDNGLFTAAEDQTCRNHTTLRMALPPSPSKARPDASTLMFGVATTLDRLEDSLLAFSHWAGHTGARILSLVDYDDAEGSASAGQVARILRDAGDLGVELEIARQNLSGRGEYRPTEGDRSFALVKYLYERQLQLAEEQEQDKGKKLPRWAAIIDDDTFFPSISALLSRLSQYNATQPQYIGGLAEDLRQLQNYGYMAYGGGGIFLSMPLLRQLNAHFDECNATGFEGGDTRLAKCIYAHTSTKLSWEPGLHQTDLHGDPSGFYEAEREQPLSMHHWKSWNEVDVVSMSAVASVCGEECLLQRFRFADGWVLVNGFSIFRHSEEYEGDGEGIAMEETWSDAGEYAHTLGPLRAKDFGKVSLRLEKSLVEGGQVRQFYVQRNEEQGDRVVEVVWRRVR